MSRCRGRTSPYQDGLTIVGMPPYASGPTAPLPPCCAASEDWLTCPPFGNCHITANSAAPAPASTVSPTAGKPFDTRSSLNAALLEAVAGNDSAAILAALKAGLPANSCVPWRSGSAGVDDDDPTEGPSGASAVAVVERSLLCLAALYGSLDVVRCLLACGANPELASADDGVTPLHAAAASGSDKTPSMIQLLLQHGAHRDAVDYRGRKPYDVLIACQKMFDNSQLEQQERLRLQELYITAKMQESSRLASQSPAFDDFDVIVGPHVPDPSGGENSDINKPEYSTDNFRISCFKVLKCTKTYAHDWTECPFVHPGEKARRRSPRDYIYTSAACPDFRKGVCRRGDLCGFSHGVFECWLHPSRYRTQMCKDGSHCTRRVCFFAHALSELRAPTPEPQPESLSPTSMGSPVSHPMPLSASGSPLTSPQSSSSDLSPEIALSLSSMSSALMGLLPAGSIQNLRPPSTRRCQAETMTGHPHGAATRSRVPLPTSSPEQVWPPEPRRGYSPEFQHRPESTQQRAPGHLSPQQARLQSTARYLTAYPSSNGKLQAVTNVPGLSSSQTSWMALAHDGSPSLRRSLTDNSRQGSPFSGDGMSAGQSNLGFFGQDSRIGNDSRGDSGPVLRRCLTDNAKYDYPAADSYRAPELQVERSVYSAPSYTLPVAHQQSPAEATARWAERQVTVTSPVHPELPWLADLKAREDELSRVGSLSLLDVSWVDSLTEAPPDSASEEVDQNL